MRSALLTRFGARGLVAAWFAVAVPAVFADVPLLDELERSVRQEGSWMKGLSLEDIAEIRKAEAAGDAVEAWRLALLISKLTEECETDIVARPDVALRKIELGLRLADAWHDSLEHWVSSVDGEKVKLLMLRWFAKGNPGDQQRAHQITEDLDRTELEVKNKGRAAYFLAATYESLAGLARKAGRSRDVQIALLRRGIEVNKAGRAQYPGYDSSVGLNALYGKLEFVSGGSALPTYLDEWIDYMRTQSGTVQGRSGSSLAEALFAQGRDPEGIAWIGRYAEYWATTSVPPALKERFQEGRCRLFGLGKGFEAFAQREPEQFASIKQRICEGRSLD